MSIPTIGTSPSTLHPTTTPKTNTTATPSTLRTAAPKTAETSQTPSLNATGRGQVVNLKV